MPSADNFTLKINKARDIADKFNLESVDDVKQFSQGMVNDVFSLDGNYVVKINTRDPDLPKLKKEAQLYDLFTEHEIPAPKVFGYDDSGEIIDYPYLVIKELGGEMLSDIWGGLDKQVISQWLETLGTLLGKIHSVEFSVFGETMQEGGFIGPSNYQDYLKKYVEDIAQKLIESSVLGEEKVQNIKNFYINGELFNIDVEPSLLHGNFIPDNIIVGDKDNVQGVIDWEWARSAHSENELAVFLYREIDMESSKVDNFLKGYKKVEGVSNEFEERLYAYNLLYYLRVLPQVSVWNHKPEKQKEYFSEVDKLYNKVIR